MNIKSIFAGLAMLFCLVALAAAAAGPARAEQTMYACKCKGIEKYTILGKTYYGDCGNGFYGANQGHVTTHIPKGQMTHYLPPAVINSIQGGCEYYESSGWNCGRMRTGIVHPDGTTDLITPKCVTVD